MGPQRHHPHEPIEQRFGQVAGFHQQRFGHFSDGKLGRIGALIIFDEVFADLVQPNDVGQRDFAVVAVVRTGPCHLHALHHVVAGLDVATPAQVGQEGCLRAAEQLFAVVGRLDAQTDSELHVGAHLVGDHTGRALSGQQQTDAKGAPQAGDAFELGAIVGVGRDHLGELVDNNKQVREYFRTRVVGTQAWGDLLTILD